MAIQTDDLKEYLGIVVDLEKNKFLQEQLMADFRHTISSLGIPQQHALPMPPTPPRFLPKIVIILGIPLCIFGAGIAAFILLIPVSILTMIPGVSEALDWIWLVVALCLFLGFVGNVWDEESSKRKKYQKERAIYEQSYAEYQDIVMQEEKRLTQENRKKRYFEKNFRQAQERYEHTARCLNKVYALDFIYEKYRTFPQVCALYEYFASGRCTTLKEAYNVFEQECLQKTIILRLDQIISQLGSIQSNQYMLYSAIQETNRKLSNIQSDINQISEKMDSIPVQRENVDQQLNELKKNSAFTAYNTERIEKELSYMNRMNYFAGKYDHAGMFKQRPLM